MGPVKNTVSAWEVTSSAQHNKWRRTFVLRRRVGGRLLLHLLFEVALQLADQRARVDVPLLPDGQDPLHGPDHLGVTVVTAGEGAGD